MNKSPYQDLLGLNENQFENFTNTAAEIIICNLCADLFEYLSTEDKSELKKLLDDNRAQVEDVTNWFIQKFSENPTAISLINKSIQLSLDSISDVTWKNLSIEKKEELNLIRK